MKMRELFTDASKWTQGAYARDATGMAMPSLSSNAVSWCLRGAMSKCYGHDDYKNIARLYDATANEPLGWWNDAPERTFAEVKALLERLDI